MSNGSAVAKRQLARLLRELREQAGLTIESAAPSLDWSSSKLSRIENAHQSVDVHGVRSMLDLYQVGGERWTELVAMAREARQRGWWRAYGLDDKGYVALESEACQVRASTLIYMPGLLQTVEYARAMFEGGLNNWTEERLEKAVAVRMIRQERLVSDTHPLTLVAVSDEAVLHRVVGGPAVMRAQLEHLVEAAALESVCFQLLPSSIGAYPGMSGAFTILSFGDLGEPDIAYVDHPMGAVHIEKMDQVTRATLVFDHLRSLALSPDDSIGLVKEVIAEL